MMNERQTDILIVGGGVGGCAAALAATSLGYRVILTEPTDWIGGQLTSQAVPPDEHPWIEQFGCTRRYRSLRDGIRKYYRDHYPLSHQAHSDPHLNPGQGYVSRICHEFKVSLAVLEGMMAYPRSRGNLIILHHRKPVAAHASDDRVQAVTFQHTQSGDLETITAHYVLDATELGDLLPLAGAEYVTGAESQDETGEPHAVSGAAQPENVQSIAWCFPLAYDPQGHHVIDEPAQYRKWREFTPQLRPSWGGRLFDWTHPDPATLMPVHRVLFPSETDKKDFSLWEFRRILYQGHYPEGMSPHEITLVNWPQIDYWSGNLIDKPEEEARLYLEEARQLSLSWLYWMQTEAPRPDGGAGYPGLYLRPDLVGTEDGLALAPYIRESRRIRARFTVTEQHVGTEARQAKSAAHFKDSVGVGCYRIDLHPSTAGDTYIDISSLPFQIPLGALLPARVRNLLPACKNIGTTHITNGCYRLHPVEWNIGEAAGLLAAFCLEKRVTPHQVYEDSQFLAAFQHLLIRQGVEIEWPALRPL